LNGRAWLVAIAASTRTGIDNTSPSTGWTKPSQVVLRKSIVEAQGQLCLGNKVRYFFYVTNDASLSPNKSSPRPMAAATKRT
jgi:hypothetical protein